MPLTYDEAQAFCTEADVIRVGGYTWTDSPASTPSATQVQAFAYAAASKMVDVLSRGGRRITPPTSGISDTFLATDLKEINATGASYFAWRVMAEQNPDDFAVEMRNQLRADWVDAVGGLDADGRVVRGRLIAIGESISGARTLANDVTTGETILPTRSGEEHAMPFTMLDQL